LELTPITLPVRPSKYRQEIERQGYRLRVAKEEILVQSQSPAGVFYGLQTLLQLVDAQGCVPGVEILDWPDQALRMIMVDPARQNENEDYYKRVVHFCARYKLNALHIHLTDDQTSCLYHEDYPALMHPQAWRPARIKDLVTFARRYHVELIPEIESLGHSSMFKRHPDYKNILHQRNKEDTRDFWWFSDVPGYNNVLCPASEEALTYLDKMYERTAQAFPSAYLHVGCDEVVMSRCARCEGKFGKISDEEWFLKHLLRCQELVSAQGRKMALWGDMLLKYPSIAEGLPREETLIFDWHYNPDVSAESVSFFQEKGFEVVACPALICMPRMVIPDERNYLNIQYFAEIARKQDLLGIDTTIWFPTRCLSDALWVGVAYAAVQSWAGSNWDEMAFYRDFGSAYFGFSEREQLGKAWKDLSRIVLHTNEFVASCWSNKEDLEQAQKMAPEQEQEIQEKLEKLGEIREELSRIGTNVQDHSVEWKAIETSAAVLTYSMEHLLASRKVRIEDEWNTALVRDLDESCIEVLKRIEADWDRNRYTDDPNKDDIYESRQNLLHSFTQMHEFHRRILEKKP